MSNMSMETPQAADAKEEQEVLGKTPDGTPWRWVGSVADLEEVRLVLLPDSSESQQAIEVLDSLGIEFEYTFRGLSPEEYHRPYSRPVLLRPNAPNWQERRTRGLPSLLKFVCGFEFNGSPPAVISHALRDVPKRRNVTRDE